MKIILYPIIFLRKIFCIRTCYSLGDINHTSSPPASSNLPPLFLSAVYFYIIISYYTLQVNNWDFHLIIVFNIRPCFSCTFGIFLLFLLSSYNFVNLCLNSPAQIFLCSIVFTQLILTCLELITLLDIPLNYLINPSKCVY